MHLKRLKISGFKSFAKPAVLDFKTQITAIVGPNGSGKSNCADGMRWVLGEQSMKSLRAKLGEDLIFNGSPALARMSKASVMLFFDNSKKEFPLEFDEVSVGRSVYRDGVNEYSLNGTKTRLKDIVELLANVGMGSSQHNIIGQGEADRILYVSSSDRKEMIEDALGLKVYHIKFKEAQRKLERTEENMKQVRALRKEIQPHLKFLRTQVEKIKKSVEYRKELEEKYKTYLFSEEAFLNKKMEELKDKRTVPEQKLKELRELKKELELKADSTGQKADDAGHNELEKIKKEISEIQAKKTRLDRDLGRLEGMIEMEESRAVDDDDDTVSRAEIETLLNEVEENISAALEESVLDQIQKFLQEALGLVSAFLDRIGNTPSGESFFSKTEELTKEKNKILEAITKLEEKENNLKSREKELGGSLYERERHLREIDQAFFDAVSKENLHKDSLRFVEFEIERLNLRREEFLREVEEATRYGIKSPFSSGGSEQISEAEREKLKRDIGRLKFRLEESGAADASVLKEYDEVEERDNFFEKELGDLEKASLELENLSKELLEKIEVEFRDGIGKINKEFSKFFGDMFLGGKAELRFIKNKKIPVGEKDEFVEGDFHDDNAKEGGIDVYVNLPRKKIQSLEMLSGGERALTSIALLFALSRVNPPPFLVLDEIDAALDEANSHRYGKMLKDLSLETQLILITHNRESMRQAGVLYGVTMGGDGTSKLLSLKLEEAEEIAS